MMYEILQHCLTGIDGKTYDPARVYLFAAVLIFFTAACVMIIKLPTFPFQEFGIGFGTLLGAGGLGIGLKAHTEPQA